MQKMWHWLQTAGVVVRRPKFVAAALLLLGVCTVLAAPYAILVENPLFVTTLGESTMVKGEWASYGFNASSIGYLTIFSLSLFWVAVGGGGARFIWASLTMVGAAVLTMYAGLTLYLDPTPTHYTVLAFRALLCLGHLVGTVMLFMPVTHQWLNELNMTRRHLREQAYAERERRAAALN